MCYNLGNLTGHEVCGITGVVCEQSEVFCCYNLGTLTGRYAFGIASSLATDSYISQVYNAGKIKGTEGEYAIIGRINEVEIKQEEEKKTENLYGTIDKLSVNGTATSQTRENLSASYYLAQDFINENMYGTALDNTAIEQQASYDGFDFDNVWEMKEQGGRKLPYLKVFHEVTTDGIS